MTTEYLKLFEIFNFYHFFVFFTKVSSLRGENESLTWVSPSLEGKGGEGGSRLDLTFSQGGGGSRLDLAFSQGGEEGSHFLSAGNIITVVTDQVGRNERTSSLNCVSSMGTLIFVVPEPRSLEANSTK